MKEFKIMITIDARWINTSGIGTYLRNIIPGIIQSFPDCNFTLLGDIVELTKLEGVNIDRVNLICANSPMYSIQEQIDYILLIPKGTTLYFSTHYNIPLLYSGPMLVMVYDVFHLAMPDLVKGIHKRIYANFMFKAVRHKAKKIITISNFTKHELIKYTGKGRQTITPIHLGVDKEAFSVSKEEPLHKHSYVLYVGNIKPHKNLSALVNAFSNIASDVPHNLILVGKKEGFITGDNAVSIVAKKLGSRIQFTGYVSDQDLKNYYSYADALVFPSLYEGFGFPPLEAMAVRCPVLASNIGPMPEVCGDGALYCDPYDIDDIATKLTILLSNHELRLQLKNKGFSRVQKFTWDKCIQHTIDVIKDLLQHEDRSSL